jgi:FkbM family methyltransferase
VRINDAQPMRVDLTFQWTLDVQYEPEIWSRFEDAVRPGDTVADVGSFAGLYAVRAGQLVGPSGVIVAFEPDPDNARLLRRHVRQNGLGDRITVVEAAAGDTAGALAFAARGSPVSGGADMYLSDTTRYLVVPVVQLDEVLAGRRLDVLKIDVEGYEERVLLGARAILESAERRPRAIFIEVHEAMRKTGATPRSLAALLESLGYTVEAIVGTEPGEPLEGLSQWVATPRG